MMPRRKRLILLVGAVVVGAWVGLRGIPSVYKGWQNARWEVQDRARLLAQGRREIASETALVDSAVMVKDGMIALASQLVTGETAAQASDALTGLLGVLSARSNTRLAETSPVEDSATVGLLRRVAIHAGLEGDIRGVTALLKSLMEEEIVLTTDDLRIVAAEWGGDPNAAEVLRVEVTVRGWYLGSPNHPVNAPVEETKEEP